MDRVQPLYTAIGVTIATYVFAPLVMGLQQTPTEAAIGSRLHHAVVK